MIVLFKFIKCIYFLRVQHKILLAIMNFKVIDSQNPAIDMKSIPLTTYVHCT